MTKFSFLFCGDFAPCQRYEPVVLERGGEVFGDLRSEIAAVDLAFANVEAPLCIDAQPIVKFGASLKADPMCATALVEAGFAVAGLANNHILDFGPEGLKSTLEACERAGLMTCGAGLDASAAAKPLLVSRNGVRIALIAVAEKEFNAAGTHTPGAAILDPIDISRQIAAVRSEVDVLVVTIHGGNEYFPFPRPGLRRLCRYITEAGADAVVCHHTHVAGAYEIHEGKPIVYSVGNLLFDVSPTPEGWEEAYAAKLVFRKDGSNGFRCDLSLIPFTQRVSDGGVRLLVGREKEAFLERIEGYRRKLDNDHAWLSEWSAFCRRQRVNCIANQYMPFRFPGMGRLIRYFSLDRLFLPRWALNRRRNMLWCDSHRELLSEILEQK